MSTSNRRNLNPWIVLGAILILIVAFILIEQYIRSIGGPDHLWQSTLVQYGGTAMLFFH